jgi:rhodanese-related sulfurtransferase
MRWRRWLAGAAALAGALAPFARTPVRRARIDVAELARAVAEQDDHVSAIELAAWLHARRPKLRVIDVRTASEYAAYHIPGAEHVPLEALATTRFAADETIVLYSELGVHGGQAWVFLRALGHRRVVFLRNGLHEWLDDVMSPTIAADAPADAQAAFDQVSELSRWFGGTPRRVGPPPADDASAAAPAATRRRGC